MITKIGLGLLAAIGIFLGYVALQPSDYVVSREIAIQAPAEKIFPYLNNSKLVASWSPWSEIDPQAKMAFSGPEEGIGSRTSWEGGKHLGTGSATVSESIPNQLVRVKLEYVKPFVMTQDAEFSVKPSESQSVVTWKVQGKNTFMGRLMCIFVDMDKRVGGTFEKGLSNLKTQVEKI